MKHSNALHKNILLLTGLQPYETTQIAFNPYNYNLRDYIQLKLLLFVLIFQHLNCYYLSIVSSFHQARY